MFVALSSGRVLANAANPQPIAGAGDPDVQRPPLDLAPFERALVVAEGRRRDAGARETDHQDLFSTQAHDVRGSYRSFSVARATSARMTEMIQKRTMTFGSGQPLSSK